MNSHSNFHVLFYGICICARLASDTQNRIEHCTYDYKLKQNLTNRSKSKLTDDETKPPC